MDKRGMYKELSDYLGIERLCALAALAGMAYGIAVGRSVRELVQDVWRARKRPLLPAEFDGRKIVSLKRKPTPAA